MDPVEPQSANDYDDRTTAAIKSVLVEIDQILGSFEGKFAVIVCHRFHLKAASRTGAKLPRAGACRREHGRHAHQHQSKTGQECHDPKSRRVLNRPAFVGGCFVGLRLPFDQSGAVVRNANTP